MVVKTCLPQTATALERFLYSWTSTGPKRKVWGRVLRLQKAMLRESLQKERVLERFPCSYWTMVPY